MNGDTVITYGPVLTLAAIVMAYWANVLPYPLAFVLATAILMWYTFGIAVFIMAGITELSKSIRGRWHNA